MTLGVGGAGVVVGVVGGEILVGLMWFSSHLHCKFEYQKFICIFWKGMKLIVALSRHVRL